MYVSFESLSEESRIWIYQGDRKFLPDEEKLIAAAAQAFCEQWLAHGNPLRTSFKIDHHQFLILAVDEDLNLASGCSIDGSVRVLKDLNQRLGIDFLDRSKVAFMLDGEVKIIPLKELKQAFASGIIGPGTSTFHVQATTKGELEKAWVVPLEKTWLVQYLPKTPVA